MQSATSNIRSTSFCSNKVRTHIQRVLFWLFVGSLFVCCPSRLVWTLLRYCSLPSSAVSQVSLCLHKVHENPKRSKQFPFPHNSTTPMSSNPSTMIDTVLSFPSSSTPSTHSTPTLFDYLRAPALYCGWKRTLAINDEFFREGNEQREQAAKMFTYQSKETEEEQEMEKYIEQTKETTKKRKQANQKVTRKVLQVGTRFCVAFICFVLFV